MAADDLRPGVVSRKHIVMVGQPAGPDPLPGILVRPLAGVDAGGKTRVEEHVCPA